MTMFRIDRREATRAAARAALLPLVGLAVPLGGVVAASHRRAPKGSFLLERRLLRELKGGRTISVVRTWKIGFADRDRGIAVTGKQQSADVAAPPALAMLADIERRRVAEDMFPITLDSAGMIVGSGSSGADPALTDAINTARQVFAGVLAGTGMASDIEQFLAQVGRTSADAVSRLPRDLFFPRQPSHRVSRQIALADGETGEIEVAITSNIDTDGLLRHCHRNVTTRMGAISRATKEDWTLARI